MKIKTLRMNNELIAEINKIAEKENRNFSNMAETLIIRGITATEQLNYHGNTKV